MPAVTGSDRVSGRTWAEALRAGDARTWRDFRAATPGAGATGSGAASAGQLEVVRRLALAHRGLTGFGRLADLVLATSPAGRGPVDQPLAEDAPRAGWGAPPVEPDALPAAELLRTAVPVLAALLPPAPRALPPAATPWRAPRFVVHGAPGAAAAVARALTAAGWVHGPFRASHLVLGCPPDEAVEQLWAHRVARGGVRGWRRTWRVLGAHPELPPALAPARVADRVAAGLPARQRQRRLHLVVAPDVPDAVRTSLVLLGLSPATVPVAVDPPGTDLRRRLNVVTTGHQRLDTTLLDAVAPQPVVPLGVPAPHRAWAAARGNDAAHEVDARRRAADYPVHGDPGVLGALRRGRPTRVDPADTLERALAAIGAAWQHTSRTEG